MSALVVFATFPEIGPARRIVRTLVDERLIACANILPGIESIYRWKGAIETSSEVFVVMKTESARYEAMQARLRELHPYEVPECIALPITGGLPDYLRWIAESAAEDAREA